MQHILRHSFNRSGWRAASARRFRFSLVLATIIVVVLLGFFRMPTAGLIAPLAELFVHIATSETSVSEPPQTAESADEVAPAVTEPRNMTVPPVEAIPVESTPHAEVTPGPVAVPDVDAPIEWEDEMAAAVQSTVDGLEKPASVNPNFDERRREAAIRFRPSEAPDKKEIWDNVEKDQIGRTILRSGNCYRVLDDPSVVNQWAFSNFDQYITYCSFQKYEGKELPWVEEIKDRHAYLRERDDRRNGIFADDPPDAEQ